MTYLQAADPLATLSSLSTSTSLDQRPAGMSRCLMLHYRYLGVSMLMFVRAPIFAAPCRYWFVSRSSLLQALSTTLTRRFCLFLLQRHPIRADPRHAPVGRDNEATMLIILLSR